MSEIKHIGRLFRIAEHAIHQEIRRHHAQMGITSSQAFMLLYLTRRYINGDTPIYAKDAEQHFSVRHSSVSGVLQRLESKGYILFQQDNADRRCKQIVPTEKALDVHNQIENQIRATEAKILHGMTEEEQEVFLRLLKQAADNLTDGAADAPPPLRENEEDEDD